MEVATSVGMSISEFWEVTPFELSLVVKGFNERQKANQKENVYQAYLISRWVWQKKVDIEKILEIKKEKKVMSSDQMLAQVKQLNALFGGSEVGNG